MTNHKIHKYKKVNLAKSKAKPYIVYRCMLPNCSHYVTEKMVLGRISLCWSCNHPFVIGAFRAKPICFNCKDQKKGVDNSSVETILKNAGVI